MKSPSISSMPMSAGGAMPSDNDGDEPVNSEADAAKAKADMMTLMEAHRIKADKPRHAAAKAVAKTHLAHITKVTKGE